LHGGIGAVLIVKLPTALLSKSVIRGSIIFYQSILSQEKMIHPMRIPENLFLLERRNKIKALSHSY